jgi:membrane associated rhomboid family serine protease
MQDGRSPSAGGQWAVMSVSHKLIILNIIVWLMWQVLPSGFMRSQFTVSWSGVFEQGYVWTLVTSAFSHMGMWHILWNMLLLHWFGPGLEHIYGRKNFLVLYLYAAVVGSLAHTAYEHGWGWGAPALGASGAVMAVVVVYAIFYPHQKILFMLMIPCPLWALACLKLAGDLAGVVGPADGIAHGAHLGGAAAGLGFKYFDLRVFPSPGEMPRDGGSGLLSVVVSWLRRAPAKPPEPQVDIFTARRVDELLAKIHEGGMESLTDEERTYLDEASGKYRR